MVKEKKTNKVSILQDLEIILQITGAIGNTIGSM